MGRYVVLGVVLTAFIAISLFSAFTMVKETSHDGGRASASVGTWEYAIRPAWYAAYHLARALTRRIG